MMNSQHFAKILFSLMLDGQEKAGKRWGAKKVWDVGNGPSFAFADPLGHQPRNGVSWGNGFSFLYTQNENLEDSSERLSEKYIPLGGKTKPFSSEEKPHKGLSKALFLGSELLAGLITSFALVWAIAHILNLSYLIRGILGIILATTVNTLSLYRMRNR